MLFSYFVLSLSLSIDSLGIGITYGLKNTKISMIAKLILFVISIFVTTLAITIGDILSNFLPEVITKLIGSSILILMGIWITFQAFHKKDTPIATVERKSPEKKVYKLFIRFLGITIQIIRDPISSDLDQSKGIDWKEAIYLGMALSLDSLCVGIGSSIIGFTSMLFPLFVATFQFVFLSVGKYLGAKIAKISNIPPNICTILSGILLICIGIAKYFV